MATTPTRQKTINDIRNNRINTISTETQPLPNQNKTILDIQSNLTRILAKNIKHNTIEHVNTRSTISTDIISSDIYHRHTTSIDTRKGRLNQLSK